MPAASQIVEGLAAAANENLGTALGVFSLFYGAFSVLRLGVWLDLDLLAGAVYLLFTVREGWRRSGTIPG